MTESIRRFRSLLFLVLLMPGLSLPAAAKPYDPEQAKWVPTRYYPAGTVVFHQGNWFESRELHEGQEPGTAFNWKRLDSVPDCGAKSDNAGGKSGARVDTDASMSETGNSERSTAQSRNPAQEPCEQPEPWLFSRSYTVGSLTRHGGKIWEAIRPTSGDLPGIAEPPHWKPVQNHCSMKDQ